MKKIFITLAIISICCTSCQKDKIASDFTPKIKGSNILDATALAQTPTNQAKSNGPTQGQILKLNSGGELSDLIVYLENYEGKEMSCKVVAQTIQNLTGEFTLLNQCYFIYPDGFFPPDSKNFVPTESTSLLFRKSNGAVYKMPHNDFNVMSNTDICNDQSNSIYFLNNSGRAMKLSVESDEVKLSQITPNEFSYRSLAVDKAGNVAVSNGEHTGADPNDRPVTRSGFHSFGHIYFANGGVKPLELTDAYRGIFSFNGEFAAIQYGSGSAITVERLKIDGQNISWEQAGSCQIPSNGITISNTDLAIECNNRFITTNWIVDNGESREIKTILLIYDGNSLSYKIEDNFPKNGYYDNNAYYVIDGFGFDLDYMETPLGDGVIFKYDFNTLSSSTYNYDVNQVPPMITSGKEVIITGNTRKFIKYGIRQSDTKPVIVEIDAATGHVNVTESAISQPIYNMVRLN